MVSELILFIFYIQKVRWSCPKPFASDSHSMAHIVDLRAGWSIRHPGSTLNNEQASCSSCHQPRRRQARVARAAASQEGGGGGFQEGLKRIARQIQGALPVVGLLSRLGSPSGGVGDDQLSYPEYCRQLLYASPSAEFLEALAEWERAYGKGGGVVSSKSVMSSARRLRVTQDIEIEMERFENSRDTIYQQYRLTAKPVGKLQDKVDLAVDSIVQLTLGLREGEEISPLNALQLKPIIAGAFTKEPGVEELINKSIESRAARKEAYMF